ncbi:MAG: type II toxin-antitoxin system HigB family toxin [Candidatus Melainabacteria bacterium]|nr:type II toxin-antitoxin system HigB family toxin [Candidatus Melainabacteria bacterium]
MGTVNAERIHEFIKHNQRATKPLRRWEAVVRESLWTNFRDVRATFNSADYVDGKVVFDIGGNKYRLVSVVDFKGQQVIVRNIMTHTEYLSTRG